MTQPSIAQHRDSYWRVPVSTADAIDPSVQTVLAEELVRLAQFLPTLCWVAHGDGAIFWYNQRWHGYCGTTPEEMEGWGWRTVHNPERLPEVMRRWTAAIETGEPFEMAFPLRGADGKFRTFLTRAVPIRTADGTIVRWLGTNTEIDAQIAAEVALQASSTLCTTT